MLCPYSSTYCTTYTVFLDFKNSKPLVGKWLTGVKNLSNSYCMHIEVSYLDIVIEPGRCCNRVLHSKWTWRSNGDTEGASADARQCMV